MRLVRRPWGLCGLLLFAMLVFATPVFAIDVEGFADATNLTIQIPGFSFTNATILTAGISLNEFEFPPRSGQNVIFDEGGPLHIVFTATAFGISEVFGISGFFTYSRPLTLTAFDALGNPLGSADSMFSSHSAFSSNLALSGDSGSSPNELLGVLFDSFPLIKSVNTCVDFRELPGECL